MVRNQENERRNGRRNGRRNRQSSINPWSVVLVAIFLFYLSFDSRLSHRSKELILFESFDGPFAENNALFATEKIFENQLPGPESLARYKGKIYTGTKDGRIMRIEGIDKLSTVVQFGPESCIGQQNIKECGRPLGVRVTSSGDLYTVDAFKGLIKVTRIEGSNSEYKLLFDIKTPVNGNASVFLDDLLDDLVIDERSPNERVIYMTDASRVWDLNNVVILVMDLDDSGRILRYTESTGKVDVVLDNLAFPNGIEMTDDKSALLIGEFTNRRVLRHYLSGPKKGITEVVIDLPGEPDNIRRSARRDQETYWVAISAPRTKASSLAYDFYSDKPWERKFMITLYRLLGGISNFIGSFINSKYMIVQGEGLKALLPFWETDHGSMALEIDVQGKVLNCLHSNNSYLHSISEILDEFKENGQRTLHIGSYANNFLGHLDL